MGVFMFKCVFLFQSLLIRYFQQYTTKEHWGRKRGIQPLLLHLLSISSNHVHLVFPKFKKMNSNLIDIRTSEYVFANLDRKC